MSDPADASTGTQKGLSARPAPGRGGAAGARIAHRRDPDRQSRRRHAARACRPRRRRPDRLRGHAGHAKTARPLRHRNPAHALPRPQRGNGPAETLRRLAQGAAVALVSDAGTPLVSDPGYKLVRAAQEAGYPVTALPGPSALLAALTVAGLPTDQFFFAGFLPPKESGRRARIAELARIPATLVLYESGPRVAATWPISRPDSGRATPRCAANSPSCTRKCGAIPSGPGARLRGGRGARRDSAGHCPAAGGAAEPGRGGRAVARGFGTAVAQGCRQRSGRNNRFAAAGALSARADIGEGGDHGAAR